MRDWLAYTVLSLGLPWGLAHVRAARADGVAAAEGVGIPVLEARMADTRDSYRDYMRTTSALVPWPPKRA